MPKTTSYRFPRSPYRARSPGRAALHAQSREGFRDEIPILVDIASRRTNFRRCRAPQPALLLVQGANVYKDIGSPPLKFSADRQGSSSCDMALDVVIDAVGQLSIEADILAVDPYKVTANGSPPKTCYVQSYMGYDQEDFQDMNRVTRRGTNWHNLQVNGQERSIEFSDGPRNCIAILSPDRCGEAATSTSRTPASAAWTRQPSGPRTSLMSSARCKLGFTTPSAI